MGKPRITGIGGIFFKSDDPAATKEWYAEHFGMNTDEYGCMFKYRLHESPEKEGHLQWSAFPSNTEYFKPGNKEFMINYRVEGIEELVQQLKDAGVEVVDDIESYDYGKFVHVMDPNGIKIELWEPVDAGFSASDKK